MTEVFGLTKRQIESLYESRQRGLAAQRTSFLDDLLMGLACLGSGNEEKVRAHVRRLLAVAQGPAPEGSAPYTQE